MFPAPAAVATAGAAAVLALMVAAGCSGPPKSPGIHGSTTTTVESTTLSPASTSTSTTTVTVPGVLPLSELLPKDVIASDCSDYHSPPPGVAETSAALICPSPDLPGGQIFAFQFTTAAGYSTGVQALNKFKGFDASTAGSTCPPASNPQDKTGWQNNDFPSQPEQILECLSVGSSAVQPDYIWTYPSEFAILDAQGAPNSSFAALDRWWTKDAPPA
ncbi:MAG TPA: hypothetical protein VHT30_06235 [Acidimicrobiales bacterium]|nr:hypothetical protein [Acidimicrobiales bacterium]